MGWDRLGWEMCISREYLKLCRFLDLSVGWANVGGGEAKGGRGKKMSRYFDRGGGIVFGGPPFLVLVFEEEERGVRGGV